MATRYYIGVDVGTSSVRAALVTSDGQLVTSATQNIAIWQPEPGYYEQSSDDIWQACCKVVQAVTQGIDVSSVRGIGFDATCSLVVLGEHFKPLTISPSGDLRCNIIMWMDHRAGKQADSINSTGHYLLRYVGGNVSLEMQLPKLLWLKQNMFDETWKHTHHLFDLPDYLTWRATGDLSRSLCSLVCKWMYEADGTTCGWNVELLRLIGLEDLTVDEFRKIGKVVKVPGEPCGSGLTSTAATDLGLWAGLPVATSIVDAHAGGVGCMSCEPDCQSTQLSLCSLSATSKLVMICGTSTCHMIVSNDAVFVRGVWGPYYSAMIPRLWLNEGGQSATGKLLDHIVSSHPAYKWTQAEAESRQVHTYCVLNDVLEFIAHREQLDSIALLTRDFHVWPDYHGNRSPLGDPSTRGMVCGLQLETGVEDLAVQYLATVQSLAYGTRHIVETMRSAGHPVELIYVCGGLAKNQLYVQCHADILGVPFVLPDNDESVLLGAAMLAACASRDFDDLQAAMTAMSGHGRLVEPNIKLTEFHERKYQVFLAMLEHQKQYKQIMNGPEPAEATPTAH